jgi:hypothetical protein
MIGAPVAIIPARFTKTCRPDHGANDSRGAKLRLDASSKCFSVAGLRPPRDHFYGVLWEKNVTYITALVMPPYKI